MWLQVNDGAEGEIDPESELEGDVFRPSKDIDIFESFRISPESGTIVWKKGAALAPEFLYENMKVPA